MTSDEHNANPGSETTCDSSAGAGKVTLRSAIELFNKNGGTDTITFNLPSPSVISLAGALNVTTSGPVTITGPGARALAVDGAQIGRVFQLNRVSDVTMSGFTVQNGKTSGDGGGIQTAGKLTLDAMVVKGNQASYAAGIDVRPSDSTPTLTMTNSTVSDNVVPQGQEGDAAISIEGSGVSNFTNDTIANNINNGVHESSAIEVYGNGATLNLNFVTVAGNQFTGTPPGTFTPAGLGVYESATANVHNSVISGNQVQDCATNGGAAGTINDQGYNLESGTSCGFTAGAPKHDVTNGNAHLQPLANNGGPTDTMALGSGSQAIDTADPTCPPPGADQRGVTRPQGPACDMGAFESALPKVTSVTASCGPASGGGSVTINGSGFLGTTSVKFGGTDAQTFTVVSDTQINATAPAGPAGQKVDITVTTPAGTSTTGSPDQCTYQVAAATASPSPSPPKVLPKSGRHPAPGSSDEPAWLIPAALLLVVASVAICAVARRAAVVRE
jgi:hypothetical protein